MFQLGPLLPLLRLAALAVEKKGERKRKKKKENSSASKMPFSFFFLTSESTLRDHALTNFRTSKHANWRILCSSEKLIDGFWVFEIVKCSVGPPNCTRNQNKDTKLLVVAVFLPPRLLGLLRPLPCLLMLQRFLRMLIPFLHSLSTSSPSRSRSTMAVSLYTCICSLSNNVRYLYLPSSLMPIPAWLI